jgi:predicted dehydrogenase
MSALVKVPGVRIAAVCDVYEPHLLEAAKLADPKASRSRHYRELLDRKDIDAVLIASPDHWHVPMAVDACDSGKDVYVEKPLTHDLSQGKAIIDAQNRHRKIIQVGMQQRSMPHIQKAREAFKAGRIGRLFRIHLTWNRGGSTRFNRGPQNVVPARLAWDDFVGHAPHQSYNEYRFRNWRWFWDFGGGVLTDLMVHWIDVAHWFMETDHPLSASAFGTHLASKDLWETPDTIQCILQYPGDVQAHFEGTFSNATRGAMIEFLGTEGTIYIDRGRYELIPEPGRGKPEQWILGSNPRKGADFYDQPDGELLHLTNWVECVRSRKTPSAPAEAGVSAAAAAHLGNQAYRSGQVAHWPTET